MNPVAATKQLESLFPTMDPATRIAVIGAGPSGLSAALALSRLGYQNITVLEQNDQVGGMCGSEIIDGHVYDLGGQVIARESSPTLDTLMREMGMELEPLGPQPFSLLHFESTEYEDLKIVADVVSMLQTTEKLLEAAHITGNLGVHAVSSIAHETANNFLKLAVKTEINPKCLVEVPKAVAGLFTASGYGYAEQMPYAYMHEFVMSCLGEPWRVKGGYSSFWRKVAAQLPDVRCNAKVRSIQRHQNKIEISVSECYSVVDDITDVPLQVLEFDKLVISGSASVPSDSRIYLSEHTKESLPGPERVGILDYTAEELDIFSKVEIIDYYTTVLKISGFEHFPPRFYYPDFAADPSTVGRFVTMQRFHADTNIFLFWSYGSAEIDQDRITQLLCEDVQKMGGCVEAVVLQRKFRYFPHVNSHDMAQGFYDKLHGLQGRNNTYYVGALLAFELTERNSSYAINLMAKCFGSTEEPIYVEKLVRYPLPNGAKEPDSYTIRELSELPGLQFPDLPTIDAYLRFYAQHPMTMDKVLYTWLDDQGKETNKLTFSELDARATTIACHLLTMKTNIRPGDCVVLLHPPGLEFIEAFLGCLRAKVLAVPLIAPDPTKRGGDLALEKLKIVSKITEAKAILSTRGYHSVVRASTMSILGKGSRWPDLPWIETNCLNSFDSTISDWLPTALKRMTSALPVAGQNEVLNGTGRASEEMSSTPDLDSVCFLQFTSGSTGDPKGVMITHGALIHNTKSMRAAYRCTTKTVCISWLPQYHDMGLIGSLLVGLVSGGHVIKFSPLTFIRKPLMWLSLVDKYRATHTAAPNFGFDLVLKRYEALKSSGKAPKLDLSTLNFLMVGAEPINSQTMRGFIETFWDSGVREEIFAPGFGLAENCVFICCAYGRNQPLKVDSQGRVSCGYIESGSPRFQDICADVRIVNAENCEEVADGIEGEIWLSSRSSGKGYWGMEELSKEVFQAQLKNTALADIEKRFVRSGDLGRRIQGNLFVTGRIKDLIIVGGRNYYPSDIEKTVENCSNLLRPGCSAAFSVASKILRSKGVTVSDDSDGIVVVAELRDENIVQMDLASKIRSAVAEVNAVQVAFVNLIKPRTIPKTTSGKIRRHECARRFAEGNLSSVKLASLSRAQARLRRSSQVAHYQSSSSISLHLPGPGNLQKSKKEISDFLIALVAEVSGQAISKVSLTESFENYSIDSQGAVLAASKLSEFLGTHISAIQIYTTGCISELASLSVQVLTKSKAATAGNVDERNPPSANKFSDAKQFAVHQFDPTRLETVQEELSESQLAEALEPSRNRKLCITALQMIGVLYIGVILFFPGVYIYEKLIQATLGETNMLGNIVRSAAVVPLAWIAYTVSIGLTISTLGARILLPMNHKSVTTTVPLWTAEYVRWWTLYRLQDFASTSLASQLRGTVLLGWWYCLLGAEIEDGVHLDTTDITDPWLVSIGRDSSVAEGVTIQSHEVNAGVVRFQSVTVGKACTIGPYSVLERGSVLESGSSIAALSKTEVGEYVSSQGSKQASSSASSSSQLAVAFKQILGVYLVGLVSAVASLAAYMTLHSLGSYFEIASSTTYTGDFKHAYLLLALTLTLPRYLMIIGPLMIFPDNPGLLIEYMKDVASQGKILALLTACVVAYMVYGVALAALTCALKWTLVGRVREGTISQGSQRRWIVHCLLRNTHDRFITLLQGTEALCVYLRMLGADIGSRASIRRINALTDPDLIKLGQDCHLGDFCKIITSEILPGGAVSSAPVNVGNRCVIGAQSVVMPGSTLQQGAVLGALSVAARGALLEEGGVYAGAPSAVKVKGLHQNGEKSNALAKSEPQIGTPESVVILNQDPLAFTIDPRFRQIVASCAGEFARKTPQGHHRYIHHLGGSGKGTLRILQNAPGLPPHDILKPGASYPAVLRCSTGNSKDDDRHAEVRGATLRLLHPDSPNDIEMPLLDLFMKTGTIFHARNMVEFMAYYIMSEEERALKIKEFPPLGEAQWLNLKRPNSWADLHFYACTARYFVTNPTDAKPEEFYVRFKLRPLDPSIRDDTGNVHRDGEMPPIDGMLPVLPNDNRPKTCVRDDFKSKLESPEGIKYMLQMQLHPIPASVDEQEEVQDPTIMWEEAIHPQIDIAELCLDEHVDDRVFDKIHFNPRFGPASLGMITATSAMQAASIDTGRALIHDLLTCIRSGITLPPIWYDLLRKSHEDLLAGRPDNTSTAPVNGNGCPIMGGGENLSSVTEEDNHTEMKNHESPVKMVSGHADYKPGKKISDHADEPVGIKLLLHVQPILQVVAPQVLTLLAAYPPLIVLAWLGTLAGKKWMFGLLPLGFLCWGLLFATLAVLVKWGTVWRIKEGSKNELWSVTTFLLTVWECINQTLGSSFLELGKGSVLTPLYLRNLGARIKTVGVYIDTLYALNPDQLKIGYRSAIGRNALLFGHLYEGEKVGFKSNIINDDTFIGARALILPGLRMEDGAELPALGLGMKDEVIKAPYN